MRHLPSTSASHFWRVLKCDERHCISDDHVICHLSAAQQSARFSGTAPVGVPCLDCFSLAWSAIGSMSIAAFLFISLLQLCCTSNCSICDW